jgi:hypothetical protein
MNIKNKSVSMQVRFQVPSGRARSGPPRIVLLQTHLRRRDILPIFIQRDGHWKACHRFIGHDTL